MSDDPPVLVTGGAGFIGSALVDRLVAEGRRVVVVDDLSTGSLDNLSQARAEAGGRLSFHRLDVASEALDQVVARQRPGVVFHLAAQINVRVSVEDPLGDAATNVLGTLRVLESARRHAVRKVVFTTSGGCIYGEPPEEDLPIPETADAPALSPYGASKRCAEEYLATYGALHGVAWTSLALSNVYGPRQDPAGEAGVVAIFTERMLQGRPCVIYGDGEQTRDFVYLDDVVHALALAADRGDGQRCNVGTGERVSVNRLFAALAAATGYRREAVYGEERPGEVRHNAVDPRKAARILGWKPWTTLEEGLASTLEWVARSAGGA